MLESRDVLRSGHEGRDKGADGVYPEKTKCSHLFLKASKGLQAGGLLALYNSRKQQQDHWAQIIGGHFFLNDLPIPIIALKIMTTMYASPRGYKVPDLGVIGGKPDQLFLRHHSI